MDNIALWITGVSAVASVIGAYFAMPGFLRYLADKRKEKRQSRIREVLLRCGPVHTGDFMFRCPALSQGERDKALQEMEQSGELVSWIDGTELRMWKFKIHPGDVGSKRN